VTGHTQNNEQFAAYWARYEPRVFAYIHTLLPNWVDAQDVLQETSIVLWEKLDQFTPGTDFVRWACRVAYFEVKKHRQRKHSQGILLSESFVDLLTKRMSESSDDLQSLLSTLGVCVEKLNPPERELIRMYYVLGADAKSAADQLGRTPDAVYKSLQRVRRKLFDCIRRFSARE
jgi:RNA polymerase sigma-70 factor, ECF subfamily